MTKFANDGSWESIERLAKNLAAKFHARVQKLRLPMDLDDCMGEVRLSYVKARRAWTPDKARFSTYFMTVTLNEFNRSVAKMAAEHGELGLFSYDDSHEDGEDGDDDYLGRTVAEGTAECPSEAIRSRETLQEVLSMLSHDSRLVVATLISDEIKGKGEPLTFKEVCANLKIASSARSRNHTPREAAVRAELKAIFGVEFR